MIVSLIGDVAGNYFTLRERDLELEIARSTRDIAERNLKLVRLRHDHGAATGLDVHQAEQFLYIATAQIASARARHRAGRECAEPAAGPASRRYRARQAAGRVSRLPPELPPGLPSSLLERRPDIRAGRAER